MVNILDRFEQSFERLLEGRQQLADDTRRTVDKLLEGFLRSLAPLGIQLIRPEPNQPLDGRVVRRRVEVARTVASNLVAGTALRSVEVRGHPAPSGRSEAPRPPPSYGHMPDSFMWPCICG